LWQEHNKKIFFFYNRVLHIICQNNARASILWDIVSLFQRITPCSLANSWQNHPSTSWRCADVGRHCAAPLTDRSLQPSCGVSEMCVTVCY
jgi:hypothetical protein